MEERGTSVQLDPLLRPFVDAADDMAAQAQLANLLTHITPLVQRIHQRSRFSEDDVQESLQQLIRVLWQCRADVTHHAIGDFERYAAVVASHMARRRWREERPSYHALKESLRHLLNNDGRFELWVTAEREWLCGLAGQRAAITATGQTTSARLAQLRQQPLAFDEAILPGRDAQRVSQAELVTALFTWVGHAFGFDQLVRLVFALRRMEEGLFIGDETDEDTRAWSEVLAAHEPPPDQEAEWRQFLTRLWAEIEQLPPLQRIAYLLNFTAGDGALDIFRLYGVVSAVHIGVVLQLTDEQFARAWVDPQLAEKARTLRSYDEKFALLWRTLPLNDQTIARLIGTERQKVINLRKAAGDRLARRLAAFRR